MKQFIGLDVSLKDTFISVREGGKRIWRRRSRSPSEQATGREIRENVGNNKIEINERRMIIEETTLHVPLNRQREFEATVSEIMISYRVTPDCLGLAIQKCTDKETLYRIVMHWEARENFCEKAGNSDLVRLWRACLDQYVDRPAILRHFELILPEVAF